MKLLKNSKISTIVLWVCMVISFGVFSFYYYGLVTHPDNMTGTSVLLAWLYTLLGVALLAVLFFSVFQLVKRWKSNKKSVFQSLVGVIVLGLLLFMTYFIGSGVPLEMSGYEGEGNTYTWLKMTDMWIYSIFILLIVSFISVVLGLIWNCVKK